MNHNECPTCHRARTIHDTKCWWCGRELPVFEVPQQAGMMALTGHWVAACHQNIEFDGKSWRNQNGVKMEAKSCPGGIGYYFVPHPVQED